MRHFEEQSFYELRQALFQVTGNIIEEHEYFYDSDVQQYIALFLEGKAPEKLDIDSRKCMAQKYAGKDRFEKQRN